VNTLLVSLGVKLGMSAISAYFFCLSMSGERLLMAVGFLFQFPNT